MTVVRIDRNGTAYHEEQVPCFRCGGTGYVRGFEHIFGGVCFNCKGCGTVVKKFKVYTPEYEAKLEARRAAKRSELQKVEEEKARIRRMEMEAREYSRREKEIERQREREVVEARWAEEKAKSNFIGEEKEKMVRTVLVKHLSSYESEWGMVNYYRFTDEEGNSLMWKTGNFLDGKERIKDQPYVYGKGDTVKIKFTVKEHKEHEGEKITYIQRVKVIED